MSQIQPEILSMEKLFKEIEKYKITIPNFQRGYTWTEMQIENLWNDIIDLYKNCEIKESNAQLFMGAITLSKDNFLLDGQQRLTTLCILLDVLIDKTRSDPYNVRAGYITNAIQRIEVLRNPKQTAEEMFKKKGGESGAQSYIAKYQDFIKKIFESDNNFDIQKLYDIICNRLFFAVITVTEKKHDVFEKINYTGKKLSKSDLLRNHLFESAKDEDERAHINSKWAELMEILGNAEKDEKRLFEWLKRDGELSQEDEAEYLILLENESLCIVSNALWEKLYHAIYSFECINYHTMPQTFSVLKEFLSAKGTAIKQIEYLIGMAKLFVNVTNPSGYYAKEKVEVGEKWENPIFWESLYLLNMTGESRFTSMAMRLLNRKHFFLSCDDTYSEIIDTILKVVVQCWLLLRLCPERNDDTRKYFISMAQKIDYAIQAHSKETIEKNLVFSLLLGEEGYKDLSIRYSIDFKNALCNHEYNSKISKMLLTIYTNSLESCDMKIHVLEASMMQDKKERYFFQVEHIVPKTPSKFSIEEYGLNPATVHQLGNLVLLEDHLNNNLNNSKPEDKMKCYKLSVLKKTFCDVRINYKNRNCRLIEIINSVKNYITFDKYVKFVMCEIGLEVMRFSKLLPQDNCDYIEVLDCLKKESIQSTVEKYLRKNITLKKYFSDNTYQPKDRQKNTNFLKIIHTKYESIENPVNFQTIMENYLKVYCVEKDIDSISGECKARYNQKISNQSPIKYDPFVLSPTYLYRELSKINYKDRVSEEENIFYLKKKNRRLKEENIFCLKKKDNIKIRNKNNKKCNEPENCNLYQGIEEIEEYEIYEGYKKCEKCKYAMSFSGGYELEDYIKGIQVVMGFLDYKPVLFLEMENSGIIAIGNWVVESNLLNIGDEEAYKEAVEKKYKEEQKNLPINIGSMKEKKYVSRVDSVNSIFEVKGKSLISLLLNINNIFKIPIYQREYVWDKSNFDQLIKDLSDGVKYIGTVIIGKTSENEYLIIDGQQRITTVAALLLELGFEIANIVTHDGTSILYGRYEMDGYDYNKLTENKNVAIQMAMRSKAWDYFKDLVANKHEWLKNFDVHDLTGFVQELANVCIIFITDHIEEYQYDVFESINGKGIPLGTEDLIRNFLYQNDFEIDNKEQEKVINKICTDLRFIMAYVEMECGKDVGSADLFDKFKECYEKNNFKTNMLSSYKLFHQMVNPQEKINWLIDNNDIENKRIRKNLLLYCILGNTTADAVILACVISSVRGEKGYKELDELIERLLGVYFVMYARNSENDKKSINAKMPKNCYKKITDIDWKELIQSFHYKDVDVGLELVLGGLFQQVWYNGATNITQFILFKIEEWLGLDLDIEIEFLIKSTKKCTFDIEHICPLDLSKYPIEFKPPRQNGLENLCLLETSICRFAHYLIH